MDRAQTDSAAAGLFIVIIGSVGAILYSHSPELLGGAILSVVGGCIVDVAVDEDVSPLMELAKP